MSFIQNILSDITNDCWFHISLTVTILASLNRLLTSETAAKRVEILINNFSSLWRKFILKTNLFYSNNIMKYFIINDLSKIILVNVFYISSLYFFRLDPLSRLELFGVSSQKYKIIATKTSGCETDLSYFL